MDFQWSEEEQELFENIVQFAKARLPKSSKASVRDKWLECGRMGLLGLSVPEQYSGMGLGALKTARAIEGFGYGCSDNGLVFSVSAQLFACTMPIVEAGSELQKNKWLPKLASGECIGANAITEAESGSDVFAMKATAKKDGDHYILNGVKSYVSNGPIADLFLVYASTNLSYGHLGITAFVVDRNQTGVTVGAPFETMGLESSAIGSVYFNEVKVSSDNVLGKEGQGATIFQKSMQWERACLFGGYLGAMQRHLEAAVSHAQSRKQFRRPIGSFQAIAHKIADMKIRLDAARLLLYHACWKMNQGQDATTEIAIAKVAISESAVQSAIELLQVHGGYGYMTESGLECELRDAIPSKIFSGTSEIQREIIARGLGL